MSEIVETVARAMAQKDAEDEGLKFPTSPTAYRTYMGLARAAIEAYEAAKREAAEPYVTRVENGVTHWSNGLCSQETPDYMKHETSVVTMPDGVQYKATWSDFGKVGGPTLKIEKQP